MEQLISMPCRPVNSKGAFSLLELLVVMAIILLLSAMATPAITSLLESNSLSSAGQTLVGQIDLARQTASTSGQTIQVRLLHLGTSDAGYDAVQIGRTDVNSNWIAVGRLVRFPRTAVVSEDTTNVSPLLATPHLETGTMAVGGLGSAPYAAISIRPSGVVEPATSDMSRFFLGIVPWRAGNSDSVPANFVFVQINPETGNTLVYRP
jgi:uncharacterized protein (TIGR02596 family)